MFKKGDQVYLKSQLYPFDKAGNIGTVVYFSKDSSSVIVSWNKTNESWGYYARNIALIPKEQHKAEV